MDNNTIMTAELQAEIEKKVAELKENDKKLKKVFPVVIEGEEDDDKPYYVGYFKRPSLASFSKFLTMSQNTSNNVVSMQTLAKECFIAGDKEMVDNEDLFLYGTMSQMNGIIEMRHGQLVNLSKPGK